MIGLAFRYLYYRLFRFDFFMWASLSRRWGGLAYGQAIGGVAASQFLYLFAVYMVLKGHFGIVIVPGGGTGIKILCLGVLALNFAVFGREKKHQEIMKEFSSEGREQKTRRGILVCLYLVGSFVSVLAAVVWH